MSFITSVWALFSKRQRIKNAIANIDTKIARIDRQIERANFIDVPRLTANRATLVQERIRLSAQLAAL